MNRERIFKILFTALIGLILLLLFRFKPSVVGPKHLEKPQLKEGTSVLSGKNFSYEVKEKNILKYTLFAEEILESGGDKKDLTNPVISIPKKDGGIDKIFAKKGTFSPSTSDLRLYQEANIKTSDNLIIKSSGFRVTPQNEVVSESRAEFEKEKIGGSGDILRYDREQRIAYLEGNITIKSENLLFNAVRMVIDLENHQGTIEGPIHGKKDDIAISSPKGTILLDSKNALESLTLQEPAEGETERFSFSSKKIKFYFKKSKTDEFSLIDNVVVVQKEEPKSKLTTEELDFKKQSDQFWHFTAPSKMFYDRLNSKLECSGGKGLIKKGEIIAELFGPVRAFDEKAETSSSRGKIDSNSFEFIGNAQVSSSEGNISAERIISYKTGEKEAYSNVKGEIAKKDGEKIYFSSEKAKTSPNIYPIKLQNSVEVKSSNLTLKGSDFTFLSNKQFKGCDGVIAVFAGKNGTIDGYGKEVDYNEEKGRCVFTGEPYILDNGRKLSAKDKITATFDQEKKVKEIIAEGSAKYESENQIAYGDRIKYIPELKKGEVFSKNEIAEVIEKSPFRRCVGRRISFSEKEIEIKSSDNKISRGKIEGREVKEKH